MKQGTLRLPWPHDVSRAVHRRTGAFVRRNNWDIGALALFTILTLVVTYPLVLHLSSRIVGCCDTWQHYWTIWWIKGVFSSGAALHPFFTDYMYYPNGTNLSFEGMYTRLLGSSLWPILGGVTTYNLLYMSNFVLSAYAVFLLVTHLTGDRKAAIVSGVIYSFSAVHLQHVTYLNISTIHWFPFLVLCVLKTIDSPTVKKAIACAVLFLLVVLSSGYYAVGGSILLVLLFLRHFKRVATKSFARYLLVFGWTSAVLIAPFVALQLRESIAGQSFVRMSQFSRYFSTDVLALVTPPRYNPLYDQFVDSIYPRFMTPFPEWESYLGFLVIPLAVIGVIAARHRGALFWLLVLAVFTLITMGPYLQVLGKVYEGIKLPFYFVQNLPGFESMRSPKQLLTLVMLAMAVLAGYGAHHVFRRTLGGRAIPTYAALSLIVVGLLFDSWGWPRSFPLSDASVPQFFKDLSKDKGDPVILHIPIPNLQNPKPLYYQTVHGKRIVGGYEAEQRLLPVAENFINDNRFLRNLHIDVAEHKAAITPGENSDALELFKAYPEIGYVVLDKPYTDWPGHKTPRLNSFDLYSPWLQSMFGGAIYEDDLIAVYEVGDRGAPIAGLRP